jgi:hypothetical protein
MVCPWYAYSQTMISEVSPLPQMWVPPMISYVTLTQCFRFLFFALFSVVRYINSLPASCSTVICRSGRHQLSSDLSSLPRSSLPQEIMTTCPSLSSSDCKSPSSSFHCFKLIFRSYRGLFSTIFLWLVDVDKSRVECEAFIKAERERKAFESLGHNASAYTGDDEVLEEKS